MPSRRSSSLSINQKLTLLIASLAILGTIIAAFISGHDWFKSQSSLPIPSKTPTPFSGKIPFVSIENPGALNPTLQWDAGSSEVSGYHLDGEAITIIAGPHTWPNFPMINYNHSITGDFSARVRIIFAPGRSVLQSAQMVGLLVRPASDHLVQGDTSFPEDWVATGKYITDAGALVGCRGSWADYPSTIVFLKIERAADTWRCAYSINGENWFYLNANVDSKQLQNRKLVISLFAYSDTNDSITAKFSDWEIGYGK